MDVRGRAGRSSGGAHYSDAAPQCAAGFGRSRRGQLGRIQPMAADHGAVQQQHRHVQAVAAGQLRVGVDVHELDGRQRQRLRAAEQLELREHLLAQPAAFAVQQRRAAARVPRRAAGRRSAARRCGRCCERQRRDRSAPTSAMDRTVSGGTSPTAVTLWPSIDRRERRGGAASAPPRRARRRLGSRGGGASGRLSTNTDTEARPSENTRCATGPRRSRASPARPARVMRKPGGSCVRIPQRDVRRAAPGAAPGSGAQPLEALGRDLRLEGGIGDVRVDAQLQARRTRSAR